MFKRTFLQLGLALAVVGAGAQAQHIYPERPIRLIVPYATGGGTDLMARILGQELTRLLGQAVVVDNKPGAGAVIGTDMVARSKPDGYTLGLTSSGHAIAPWLQRQLPYDAVRSFAPVAQVASGPNVLVVHGAVPANTLPELIALLRSAPGRYSFGSAGLGNPTHLAGEVLQSTTRTQLIHVPYKGSGQAETGLAGGEITMIIDSIPAALPFILAGKTRALAVTGKKRFPLLPDVPTTTEAGLPELELTTWWGVIAPAGTPASIVSVLNTALDQALKSPEVRAQFLKFGAEPALSTAADFGEHIRVETERYGRLIKALGITPPP